MGNSCCSYDISVGTHSAEPLTNVEASPGMETADSTVLDLQVTPSPPHTPQSSAT